MRWVHCAIGIFGYASWEKDQVRSNRRKYSLTNSIEKNQKWIFILSYVGYNRGSHIYINSRIVRTFVRLYKQLLSYHKPTRTNRMAFLHNLCGYFSSRTASAKIWPYPAHFYFYCEKPWNYLKNKPELFWGNMLTTTPWRHQRPKSHSMALPAVATQSWHKLCLRSIYKNNKLLFHNPQSILISACIHCQFLEVARFLFPHLNDMCTFTPIFNGQRNGQSCIGSALKR